MPWSCKSILVFILPSNHFWNWDVQREELTNVQREKEREKERLIDAAAQPQTQRRDRTVEFLVRAADLSLSWSPFPFWIESDRCSIASIAISPSRRSRLQHRADHDCSTATHDLAFTSVARSRLSLNPVAPLSSFFS